MKKIKIAQIGTFDVENFGDLLFPEVLKKQLGSDYEIDLFSPLGGQKPFDNVPVFPVSTLESKIIENKYKGIVIGGGDLIRTDQKICIKNDIYGYSVDPSLELWAYPIILANKYDIPVMLNSVGVTNDFKSSEKFLVKTLLENVDYISTRDTEGNNALKKIGFFDVPIVPDTVLTIKDVYSDDELENNYKNLQLIKIMPQINDYIIFQHNSTNIDNHKYYSNIIELIKKVSERHAILLMPIGYIHDDDKILQKIYKENIKNVYMISNKVKLCPKDMLSIIKNSYGYIGTSMHGAVVSYAYEKKILILNSMDSKKLHGFANIISKTNLDVNNSDVLSYIYDNYYEKQNTNFDFEIYNKIIEQFTRFKEITNSNCKRQGKNLSIVGLIKSFYDDCNQDELIGEYYIGNDYLNRKIFKYKKDDHDFYTFKIDNVNQEVKLRPIINKCCFIKKLCINSNVIVDNPELGILYNKEYNIESNNSSIVIKIKPNILNNREFIDLLIAEKNKNCELIKCNEKSQNELDILLDEYKSVEKKYCDYLKKDESGE